MFITFVIGILLLLGWCSTIIFWQRIQEPFDLENACLGNADTMEQYSVHFHANSLHLQPYHRDLVATQAPVFRGRVRMTTKLIQGNQTMATCILNAPGYAQVLMAEDPNLYKWTSNDREIPAMMRRLDHVAWRPWEFATPFWSRFAVRYAKMLHEDDLWNNHLFSDWLTYMANEPHVTSILLTKLSKRVPVFDKHTTDVPAGFRSVYTPRGPMAPVKTLLFVLRQVRRYQLHELVTYWTDQHLAQLGLSCVDLIHDHPSLFIFRCQTLFDELSQDDPLRLWLPTLATFHAEVAAFNGTKITHVISDSTSVLPVRANEFVSV